MTGHRHSHRSFPLDPSRLDQTLASIFDITDRVVKAAVQMSDSEQNCTRRLLTLLADGTDHHAARHALARGWDLTIPLPFGRALNSAINASPASLPDVRAMLVGAPVEDPQVARRFDAISSLASRARLLELADEDERITGLLLAAAEQPDDQTAASEFALEAGQRSALAGRIVIEQTDLIIAVWDGSSTASVGGTGHTAAVALELGSPVLWIDPARPEDWRMVLTPEELVASPSDAERDREIAKLTHIITGAITLSPPDNLGRYAGLAAIEGPSWREKSTIASHGFRRLEALFGETGLTARFQSLRQCYERPSDICLGSSREMLKSLAGLGDADTKLADAIAKEIVERFAWIDGISAHLSDRYRSGMIVNFLLGAMAIIAGILYLPLVHVDRKWLFAAIELALLLAIVANTVRGQLARLHGRWFETRRAAEYLRHSPMVVALGVARPPGTWPQGTKSWWPEYYVRHVLRGVGLPEAKIDKAYLRTLLVALRDHHVEPQRKYHRDKASRLTRVHHGIDRLSGILFVAAIVVVALFLALWTASGMGLLSEVWISGIAKWFTVLAVALPTLGGAFAGIRYFGDFERFAEISEVTSEKLATVAHRIAILLSAPGGAINYRLASAIIHATDQIVFSEIENWQSVFSGKRTAVPA